MEWSFWIIVVVILNGGHATELSPRYESSEQCIEAARHISVGMAASVNCVPSPANHLNQ